MATSPDTVLRLVHGMTLPPTGPLRAVGIDDWAIRKGQTYGTLIVDLDRRRPIDLLPDRSSTTVAAWLRCHPGIAVITRDRSSEYARAATMGAPAALQGCGDRTDRDGQPGPDLDTIDDESARDDGTRTQATGHGRISDSRRRDPSTRLHRK
jgi:hypothetical protein